MRIARAVGTALCLVLVAAGSLQGQDVTGTWVLAVDLGAAGGGDATFELVQEGTEITGTYTGALGVEPVTGTIEGTEVTFTFGSQAGTITYTGTIEDDTMSGSCVYGELGDGTFSGKKSDGSIP